MLAHIAEATKISQPGRARRQRALRRTRQGEVAAEVYRASVLDDATVARFRGRFDLAVMAAVLHHLVGATRRTSHRAANRAVSNALELVKPGGT